MALKNIPDPGFADDTGEADAELAEALRAWQADRTAPAAEQRVLAALSQARLLVPVVAVLGESETDASGLRRDKSSDMAVPTLTAPGGRRALPAFTSTSALARWREDARPVAVRLPQALQALAQEQADTLVVDLAGPVTYQLTGAALRSLAGGGAAGGRQPLAGDPAVADALRTLLAAEPGVAGAHLAPGGEDSDATLALALATDADAATTAGSLSRALAADETLRSCLVRGLALAVLPPGTELPRTALYRR